MNVVGRWIDWSVSFEAIQTNRGDSSWLVARRPALTKCHRSMESAVAQPTQDPVVPWSLIAHQPARRSFEVGIAAGAGAATMFASAACSNVQSSSVFGDLLTLRMRLVCGRGR